MFFFVFWLFHLWGDWVRLFAQIFVKQGVITFLDNDLHRVSEVINVPFINIVDIVLLQHHWVMNFPGIVNLLKIFWHFDLKWLVDNFIEVLLLSCDVSEPFLLCWRLVLILLTNALVTFFVKILSKVSISSIMVRSLLIGMRRFDVCSTVIVCLSLFELLHSN